MTTRKSIGKAAFSTLVAALILAACGGEKPESMLVSAKEYLAKNDTKAAEIQLKNALQEDRNMLAAQLLLAQAYQESTLNQGARSRQGALGVMQVLPSTAREPYINVRNIGALENNVHAGTKYMRYMMDNYFDDAALDENIRHFAYPNSRFKGSANLLIMPNLDAANISFNLLKATSGNNVTIGPILLGAAKPVHILTPTATTRRLVNMTALTVAEIQENEKSAL